MQDIDFQLLLYQSRYFGFLEEHMDERPSDAHCRIRQWILGIPAQYRHFVDGPHRLPLPLIGDR
jgi:hypothetical protein